MNILRSIAVVALFLLTAAVPLDEPALRIRLGEPQTQAMAILDLFQPPTAPNPATALANWKRATKGKGTLGKGLEAAIASLNPAMVDEFKVLKGAEFVLDFSSKTGNPLWSFSVPLDDGTFAAVATALALTDGSSEPPLGTASVDRLGKPGAALMARDHKSVIIAMSREMLERGLEAIKNPTADVPLLAAPRYEIQVAGLSKSSSVSVRRAGEILRGLGASEYRGLASLVDSELLVTGSYRTAYRDSGERIDSHWLDEIPAAASLVFSVVVDHRDQSWDRLFSLADRVMKTDPANLNLAPLRTRIGVICRLAGLDLETDLWPKLRGMSGFVMGEARKPTTVALALHAVDPASAIRFRDHVLPRLARAIGLHPSKAVSVPEGTKELGEFQGQKVWITISSETTVWISWEAQTSLSQVNALRSPRLLDKLPLKTREQVEKFSRVGWVWPSRLELFGKGSPLSEALAQADPIRWSGRLQDQEDRDLVTWSGLDRAVHRFLELIPQQPAAASPK